MIKQFFLSIFTFSFFILMLLNIMVSFNIGGFENVTDGYFGVTTLIDAFQVDAQIEGTIPYYVSQAITFINSSMSRLTGDISNQISDLIERTNNLSYVSIDYSSFSAWQYSIALNLDRFFSIMTSGLYVVFESIGVVAQFLGMLVLYLYYLVSVFFAFITGQYYSIMPSPTWTYPNLVGGYIPSTITI